MTLFQTQIEIPEAIEVQTTDVITIGEIIGGVVVFLIGILIAQLARRAVRKAVQRIPDTSEFAVKASGQIAFWIGLVLGTIAALAVLGINLGPIIATLLVVFVVLAFAMRSFIDNFAAGLILQARRPFRPGHLVSVQGADGKVIEINNRTVVVDTWDGRRINTPSRVVLEAPITNHTVRGYRRTTLDVGVAYDTDLAEAQRVLLEAVQSVDGVFSNPAPEALVIKFGDSSIDFSVRFFHKPVISAEFELRDQVARALKTALDEAGIVIAFPQRVVWQGQSSDSEGAPDSL